MTTVFAIVFGLIGAFLFLGGCADLSRSNDIHVIFSHSAFAVNQLRNEAMMLILSGLVMLGFAAVLAAMRKANPPAPAYPPPGERVKPAPKSDELASFTRNSAYVMPPTRREPNDTLTGAAWVSMALIFTFILIGAIASKDPSGPKTITVPQAAKAFVRDGVIVQEAPAPKPLITGEVPSFEEAKAKAKSGEWYCIDRLPNGACNGFAQKWRK